MYVGPRNDGMPLEIGVLRNFGDVVIIHAMKARPKFLKGWWIP
jgi:hypothetical protein